MLTAFCHGPFTSADETQESERDASPRPTFVMKRGFVAVRDDGGVRRMRSVARFGGRGVKGVELRKGFSVPSGGSVIVLSCAIRRFVRR